MSYALWDHRTRNRLGVFATREEALQTVAAIVAGYRSRRAKAVEWLSLIDSNAPEGQRLVAAGRELAELSGGLAPREVGRRPARRKRAAA